MGKVGKSLVPYMTYEQVKRLKQEDFKRLCGVRPETFNQMLEVVRSGERHKRKTGRPAKLNLEDQLLMTLEYCREYRTYFHKSQSWGVNESVVMHSNGKLVSHYPQSSQTTQSTVPSAN